MSVVIPERLTDGQAPSKTVVLPARQMHRPAFSVTPAAAEGRWARRASSRTLSHPLSRVHS